MVKATGRPCGDGALGPDAGVAGSVSTFSGAAMWVAVRVLARSHAMAGPGAPSELMEPGPLRDAVEEALCRYDAILELWLQNLIEGEAESAELEALGDLFREVLDDVYGEA